MEECVAVTQGCQVVIHLAAVTGGIEFSSRFPASQYFDSTRIDLNMMEAARRSGAEKFVAIGNLFAYSQEAATPLEEECLFSGLPGDAHRGVGWLKRNLAVMAGLYYREHRFPVVVVYSANGYGPRDSAGSPPRSRDTGDYYEMPGRERAAGMGGWFAYAGLPVCQRYRRRLGARSGAAGGVPRS